MRRLWLAPALALSSFLAAPAVGAASLSDTEHIPVAAAMTTVGPHRMTVVAIGRDIFGVIVDQRMYARSFRDDVHELDLTLEQPGGPSLDNFTLYFGSGTAECSVTMPAPRSGTGMLASTASVVGSHGFRS